MDTFNVDMNQALTQVLSSGSTPRQLIRFGLAVVPVPPPLSGQSPLSGPLTHPLPCLPPLPSSKKSRSHRQSARPTRTRNDNPYGRPPNDRDAQASRGPGPSRRNNDPPIPGSNLAARIGAGASRGKVNAHPRRAPEGTPPIFKVQSEIEQNEARKGQLARLNEKLKTAEMKQWLRSRQLGPGIMDMSVSNEIRIVKRAVADEQKLPQDEWLNKENIVPPGHRSAPHNAGTVFWKLIDTDIQRVS